ncbi:endolytic transglycosylase MltG, partial [Massilia alkalitolerans]|uniref:endolytic transglycosylase MltG n=1 Tax=Massilia alkalitolerans TaxID=286638 RepID=UPI0028AE5AF6
LFAKGSSELEIYKKAHQAMMKHLQTAWEGRDPSLPYKTPYEALTMASIIEKETGQKSERNMIAGVFVNRLRTGMMLQTDPTVIYGMGERYVGDIRKKDLQTDTPYNTYMRAGLPPTPIALPGMQSLHAALAPAKTEALYFVARGDGTSQFSDNLNDHNRAVNQYQRRINQ